ncbi:hypothetical protein DPMN_092163 [Dreissena polymorpha]|uniref:Uncharacterized protein n=1 Tax=Dreissena polymorpha TaxID=45954 RepID=A0A9D4L1U8_DREPO|nr:hypothetical protein DPMN_092163 [Dreissena polymorpha]
MGMSYQPWKILHFVVLQLYTCQIQVSCWLVDNIQTTWYESMVSEEVVKLASEKDG